MTGDPKNPDRLFGVKTVISVFFLSVAVKVLEPIPRLWPWGLASPVKVTERPKYSNVDFDNDTLQGKHGKLQKILERVRPGEEPLLKGAETIVFGKDGTLFALTEEGKLVSFTEFETQGTNNADAKSDILIVTAKSTLVANLGVGRPLSGSFDNQNTFYIADAHLGLTRLKNPGEPGSKVELIASTVFDEGKWTQINYCNDVVVGPKTGMVYFTDSTDIAPDRVGTRTWDTMYGAKTDLMRGRPTGRLLRYDPSTDQVTVLARNLYFPNGIAVDEQETMLFFAETFALKLVKFSLEDNVLTTVVSEELTGYPDGVDCSGSRCYAVMPSAIPPLVKWLLTIPYPFDMVVRSLLMALPKKMAPPVKKYGGIMEVDAFGAMGGGSILLIQDPSAADVGMINGVTVHNNKLYLGSLQNNFIAVYDPS